MSESLALSSITYGASFGSGAVCCIPLMSKSCNEYIVASCTGLCGGTSSLRAGGMTKRRYEYIVASCTGLCAGTGCCRAFGVTKLRNCNVGAIVTSGTSVISIPTDFGTGSCLGLVRDSAVSDRINALFHTAELFATVDTVNYKVIVTVFGTGGSLIVFLNGIALGVTGGSNGFCHLVATNGTDADYVTFFCTGGILFVINAVAVSSCGNNLVVGIAASTGICLNTNAGTGGICCYYTVIIRVTGSLNCFGLCNNRATYRTLNTGCRTCCCTGCFYCRNFCFCMAQLSKFFCGNNILAIRTSCNYGARACTSSSGIYGYVINVTGCRNRLRFKLLTASAIALEGHKTVGCTSRFGFYLCFIIVGIGFNAFGTGGFSIGEGNVVDVYLSTTKFNSVICSILSIR